MRRTPEPIEPSPSRVMRPMWPVVGTWVPPHSSRSNPSPIVTTRTREPYFSPKSAIAPWAFASSRLISSVVTVRSSASFSLTSASMSPSWLASTALE